MEKIPELDTSKQDWATEFLANTDSVSTFILPASISGKSLSEYIAGLSNTNGGCILVGAYSEFGLGSGFQNVSPELRCGRAPHKCPTRHRRAYSKIPDSLLIKSVPI